ncbi:hypothetical protein ACHWQZ_G014623 [Mnemiopsis leidyi]
MVYLGNDIMKKIIQVTRLLVTVALLIIPPTLLIAYARKYATLTWKSTLTHGIFMLFGFCTLLGTAVTSFKNIPIKSHLARKAIHGALNTACLVFMFIGWKIIYDITHESHGSHSHHKRESLDQRSDHYLSVHSWIGVLTMVTYSLTWVFGACFFSPFLNEFWKPSIRKAVKPFHISAGLGVTLLAAASTTTGLYNYTEKYVPDVFKSSQTPALRLILSASLFLGIAFFVLFFSLRAIHPESESDADKEIKQNSQIVVMTNDKMANSST